MATDGVSLNTGRTNLPGEPSRSESPSAQVASQVLSGRGPGAAPAAHLAAPAAHLAISASFSAQAAPNEPQPQSPSQQAPASRPAARPMTDAGTLTDRQLVNQFEHQYPQYVLRGHTVQEKAVEVRRYMREMDLDQTQQQQAIEQGLDQLAEAMVATGHVRQTTMSVQTGQPVQGPPCCVIL